MKTTGKFGSCARAIGGAAALMSGLCATASEVDTLDLSGGCQAAQDKAAAYIRRISSNMAPGVCSAGKTMRLTGEAQVRVAELCQEIPQWTQLRDQGRKLISEADETIRGTCVR